MSLPANQPPDPVDDAPGWTLSAAAFRLAPLTRWPSPAQRAAVAARPRFYRLPWLVPAADNAHDPDPLLF